MTVWHLAKWRDHDVAVPDRLPMILQSKVTGSWHVFKGFLEFVFGAVGIFLSGIPVVDIDIVNLLAIEHHGDLCPLAGQAHGVPLAVGLEPWTWWAPWHHRESQRCVCHCTSHRKQSGFQTSLHRVLGIGAEEKSTVALLRGFIFQGDVKVPVGRLRPEDATRCLRGGQHPVLEHPVLVQVEILFVEQLIFPQSWAWVTETEARRTERHEARMVLVVVFMVI